MNFVWINPVVEQMYGDKIENIYNQLKKLGYEKASCSSPAEEVKQKFCLEVEQSDKLVIDSRCPRAVEMIIECNLASEVTIAQVEPILIHIARRLYDENIANSDEARKLIMVCPCQYLADFGQRIFDGEGKENIVFCTWNPFVEQYGFEKAEKISRSPIPLGFFDDTPIKVAGFTDEDEMISGIRTILREKQEIDLAELLYCRDGCNNGDGLGW